MVTTFLNALHSFMHSLSLAPTKINMLGLLAVFSLALVGSALGGPPLQLSEESFGSHQLHNHGKGLKSNSILAESYRLPGNFRPHFYDIYIVPILPPQATSYQDFDIPARVEILVECLANTQQLTLNSRNITVSKINVTDASGVEISATLSTNVQDEFLHINTQGTEIFLAGENYIIEIEYKATVQDDVFGLYRANYVNEQNRTVWLATTQMETTGFRRLVPSFDEPSYKAVFRTNVGYDPRLRNTLSNTLPTTTNSTDDPYSLLPAGYVWDTYSETVTMSSYLYALTISDFKCEMKQNTTLSGGKPVGVCGPPHLIDMGGGKYAADMSDRILKAFEDEFKIEYKEQKMHSVAIPRNFFAFGAMENYGLNIYRDNLLLEYGSESLENDRYRITSILSHELAHQWFGNLVTTGFWNHIWLNEGFATYMAYIGVQNVTEAYEDIATSLIDSTLAAMRFDVTAGSHPVINKPNNLEEIASLLYFDTISYSKGGSLLRMMENFLGRDALFNSIRSYLQNKTFDNSFQEDLFAFLQMNVNDETMPVLTIEEIMNTWTLQEGFPLVRVTKGNDTTAYISQERYTLNNKDFTQDIYEDELDPNDLWHVPVSLVTAANPNFASHAPEANLWIAKNEILKPIPVNTSQWFMINPEGYGYYRVLYEPSLLRLIQNQLNTNHSVISSAAKAKLMADYIAFVDNGYAPLELALGNMKFIGDDNDQLVWKTAVSFFNSLSARLTSTDSAVQELTGFLGPKLEKALAELNVTETANEYGIKTILRPQLLDWACFLDQTACLEAVYAYLPNWTSTNKSDVIPMNLRKVVVCAGVAKNDEAVFNRVLDEYSSLINPSTEYESIQASYLLAGMACTTNSTTQDWLLNQTLVETDPVIKVSDRGALLNALARSSRSKVYEFLGANWDKLAGPSEQGYPGRNLLLGALETIRNYQNAPADLATHQQLIQQIQTGDVDLYGLISDRLNSITTVIQANIQWATSQLPIYKSWFANNA